VNWHCVWAEPGLRVVDRAAVGANLGANPSLTIAAQAERACAFLAKSRNDRSTTPAGVVLRAGGAR
jgi:cholesterol oxidase